MFVGPMDDGNERVHQLLWILCVAVNLLRNVIELSVCAGCMNEFWAAYYRERAGGGNHKYRISASFEYIVWVLEFGWAFDGA